MAGEMTATGATVGSAISPGLGTVIGAGAGLVGDVLGGLFGSSSSRKEASKNRKEARRQFNEQMDFNKNATQYRVQDALKAGINPLAALGVSSNVSPTVSTGYGSGDQSWSNAASRAGDRLQNMIQRLTMEKAVDDTKYNREAQALDLESRRLQNDHLRLQNSILTQPGLSNTRSRRLSNGAWVTDVYEGRFPGSSYVNTEGGTMVMPSSDVADRMDIEFGILPNPYAIEYALRDYGGRLKRWVDRHDVPIAPRRVREWRKRTFG